VADEETHFFARPTNAALTKVFDGGRHDPQPRLVKLADQGARKEPVAYRRHRARSEHYVRERFRDLVGRRPEWLAPSWGKTSPWTPTCGFSAAKRAPAFRDEIGGPLFHGAGAGHVGASSFGRDLAEIEIGIFRTLAVRSRTTEEDIGGCGQRPNSLRVSVLAPGGRRGPP